MAVCTIRPIADALVWALRDLGHEPVALLAPRREDEQEELLRLNGVTAPPCGDGPIWVVASKPA